MMTWRLKRTTQCAKCPRRMDVDPHDIPNGYSEDRHRALSCTIAKPGDLSSLFGAAQHIMACHETHDAHCLGWLINQVGPGNNLALRMSMMTCENARAIKLVGEQHATFADTLPKVDS